MTMTCFLHSLWEEAVASLLGEGPLVVVSPVAPLAAVPLVAVALGVDGDIQLQII